MTDKVWVERTPNRTPYVDWFFTREKDYLPRSASITRTPQPDLFSVDDILDQLKVDTPVKEGFVDWLTVKTLQPVDESGESYAQQIENAHFENGMSVPLPDRAFPANNQRPSGSILPPDDELREIANSLPDDAVITGIIDSGIGLGHARFRAGRTGSRIISSWQQAAPHLGQGYLPFGEELLRPKIEDLMRRNTFAGTLDEDAFNREATLSELERQFSPKDLERNASHGTHVLDLAAGLDPDEDPETLARRPIIAVNLPDRFSHGSAGNFLEYFAVYGLERIVMLADRLWELKHPKQRSSPENGFRVVINLSYGMQAGPKTGFLAFEQVCSAIIKAYQGRVAITLPAGNDNLDRGHGHSILGSGWSKELTLPWRICPADQTANFAELWTSPKWFPKEMTADAKEAKIAGFEVALVFAGEKLKATDWFTPEFGKQMDLTDGVRVYCEHFTKHPEEHENPHTQIRILFCLAPTHSWVKNAPTVRAGLWHIHVRYDGEPVEFALNIQSDQALTPGSSTAKRSYFDHDQYRTHIGENDARREDMPDGAFVPLGKLADTYHYPDGTHLENWLYRGPVQRKGTVNAIASAAEVCAIGGYRRSDGMPAPYSSSTGGGRDPEAPDIKDAWRQFLTAAFPSDDGYARLGLRAAGSRSGGSVAWQGTSMASACAARFLVEACLDDPNLNPRAKLLNDQADQHERAAYNGWPEFLNCERMKLKLGSGRIRISSSSMER